MLSCTAISQCLVVKAITHAHTCAKKKAILENGISV